MKIYTLIFSILVFVSSALAVPSTFDVEVSLDNCPEKPVQPTLQLEIYYSVGSNPTLLPANVISLNQNSSNNTATAVLRFPTNLGSTPFNIQARCVDTNESSSYSNKISLSNCNYIETIDSDKDGIANRFEDTNCSNSFSTTDFSNFDNIDTDGDGVRDFSEVFTGTNPKNPGSSFIPLIFSSAPFDPNQDGESNPIAWRPSNGTFYIKDAAGVGKHRSIKFGRSGDIPITYTPADFPTSVGIVRKDASGNLNWYLNGPGFKNSSGTRTNLIILGKESDHLVHGSYESASFTNPAVAELVNGQWVFIIRLANGSIKTQNWGISEDIPRPQDYDGDGKFDFAVFRPSTLKTYILNSSNSSVSVLDFGSKTSEYIVKGDYTGDGKADISFWEPLTAVFFTMKSDNGFNSAEAALMNPLYYEQLQLGLYFVHYPLNYNRKGGRIVYTVSDRSNGARYYKQNNQAAGALMIERWGIPGDHLG